MKDILESHPTSSASSDVIEGFVTFERKGEKEENTEAFVSYILIIKLSNFTVKVGKKI